MSDEIKDTLETINNFINNYREYDPFDVCEKCGYYVHFLSKYDNNGNKLLIEKLMDIHQNIMEEE